MKTSVGLAAGVALLLALPALADPGPPQESEGKALQRAARNFARLRGYAVTAHVEGGMAQGPEHRLTSHTVNTTYTALVRGAVCKVEAPRAAFRTRQGQDGTIQEGARWAAMLATDDGRLMERLFVRPEALLAECLRLKKAARWVPPAAGADPSPAPPADLFMDADDADDEGGGTQTRDEDQDDDGHESQAPGSNHLRIEGPPALALQHFLRIQNSGCFSEG